MYPPSCCHVSDKLSDKALMLSLMEQKVLEGTRAGDCFTALTCRLGQPTSGHRNVSEIRRHLLINDILQLMVRVVFVLFFPPAAAPGVP